MRLVIELFNAILYYVALNNLVHEFYFAPVLNIMYTNITRTSVCGDNIMMKNVILALSRKRII